MDSGSAEGSELQLSGLTVQEIRAVLRQSKVRVGRVQCAASKSQLLAFAVSQGPEVIEQLRKALDTKSVKPTSVRRNIQVLRDCGASICHGKRKRSDLLLSEERLEAIIQADLSSPTAITKSPDRRKRKRKEESEVDPPTMADNVLVTGCHTLREEHSDKFMTIPSEEELRKVQLAFLSRTTQTALEEGVCGICARETPRAELVTKAVRELPNPALLVPAQTHPAQDLHDGLLLEPAGMSNQSGDHVTVHVCAACFTQLNRNQRPRFGLSNGLWIGQVPDELQQLSIPEQLLIALTFPRCFVFKMHPKIGRVDDPATLQRGMVGNVTSFPMNTREIIKMVNGLKLPQPVAVLPALIAVTLVGAQTFPKNWLKGVLRVRRERVRQALEWLMRNNHLYQEFVLDAKRLAVLPEDDIPFEIQAIVRQETDTSVLVEEAESYVPGDIEIGNDGEPHELTELALAEPPADLQEGTVQLAHLGTTASFIETQTDADALVCAVQNLAREGTYDVRPGRSFVNDFPERKDQGESKVNYSAGAFPTLFPYGIGGVESQEKLGFLEHVRYCLLLHDRRFRTHHSFPFVMFGIHQKRQALASARIQVRRRDFERVARDILQVSREDLNVAAKEKDKGMPISNAKVRSLLNSAKLTTGRIVGTDQARAAMRSKIWSTSVFMGPPSIWMTINLADVHDPIAQLFCGEEINIDKFDDLQGRCANNIIRSQNIAKDPFAAAKYFHVMIGIILEALLGIRTSSRMTYSKKALLGNVSAYTGAVESQNRASLHLHILLWLLGAPTASEMKGKFLSAEFRQTVSDFIAANIHASAPGLSHRTIASLPRESDLAYSRPPNPTTSDFEVQFRDRLVRLVRNMQVHVCVKGACRRFDLSKGSWSCKRRAPWPESDTVIVNPDGSWNPIRHYGMVNNFHPQLLFFVQCNGDIKLLTNGEETKNITWYIAKYATKAQKKLFNASALLASSLAFHFTDDKYLDDIRARSRLLLFRCFQGLNRQQEQSAPQVISYLMGWDDCFMSHEFVPLYISALQSYLHRQMLAMLSAARRRVSGTDAEDSACGLPSSKIFEASFQLLEHTEETGEERIALTLTNEGAMTTRSQVNDYLLRGQELEDFSFVSFVVDTYEESAKPMSGGTALEGESSQPEDNNETRGRRRNMRSPYLIGHPNPNRTRVVRTRHHNTLPNFVGPWMPRANVPETLQYYCCVMLALLKPWRTMPDLFGDSQNWSEALTEFLERPTSLFARRFVDNSQFYYECRDASLRQDLHTSEKERAGDADVDSGGESDENPVEEPDDPSDAQAAADKFSEGDLDFFLRTKESSKEQRHGAHAVKIAVEVGIFDPDGTEWEVMSEEMPSASEEHRVQFDSWKKLITEGRSDIAMENTGVGEALEGSVIQLDNDPGRAGGTADLVPNPDSLPALNVEELNSNQRRAFELVRRHLSATAGMEAPPQLLMQLVGEGGTGKSRVIQTITKAFEVAGLTAWLRKAAYTGIAACLIGGQTLHSLFGVNLQGGVPSEDRVRKLAEQWKLAKYLIIDEYSMISREFLATLSKTLNIICKHLNKEEHDSPFGGVNVILCGDFHQFPPVKGKKRGALYYPSALHDSKQQNAGSGLYEQFTTVVILEQQMRISDPVWHELLQRARHGRCEENDFALLREMQLKGGRDEVGSVWEEGPWTDAVLVTPRNAVRKKWNHAACRQHCKRTKQQLLRCPAEETKKSGGPLTTAERLALLKRKYDAKATADDRTQLEEEILLAKGMKVMLVTNIQTEFDMANGARGKVVGIILDPREPDRAQDRFEQKLQFPPACVLVKLDRLRVGRIGDLPENVVPIFPTESKIRLQLDQKTLTITRRQLPLTPAYAFTDYRAQGQTLQNVIIDLGRPPTGKLTPFNAYVSLSRSSGRDTIRLLRDFDETLFTTVPSEALETEDSRLQELARRCGREHEEHARVISGTGLPTKA